jgi:hypothetical protein
MEEVNKQVNIEKPWLVDSISNVARSIKYRLKWILLVLAVVVGGYYFNAWFGWYYLGGFAVVPFLAFWIYRQMDKQAYLLLELRLPGEKFFDGFVSPDLKTMIHQIPPDIWRTLKKEGVPFEAGQRFFFCDAFDQVRGKIYFPKDPMVSNVWFWTRVKEWLKLKEEVPELKSRLAVTRLNIKNQAMERALDILEKVAILENFREEGTRTRRLKADSPQIDGEGVHNGE